ncbi:hypothetical protein AB6A40_011513 [Gnathostoma spinigerum]|uniref:Uncharacterized protein n=1 Tax=Gnathostoma spinigerum TaxID=75299 RepID=A0ABD6F1W8_9BILA
MEARENNNSPRCGSLLSIGLPARFSSRGGNISLVRFSPTEHVLMFHVGHFKVRSIRKIRGDPQESRLYKLEVIEPIKGVQEGEVVEKRSPAVKHGGLSLRIGGEYVLSGIDDLFGQCSQLLRDEEINFKKMTEEQKEAFRKIDLDCSPPKPEEPEVKPEEPEVKPEEPEVKPEEPEVKPKEPEVEKPEEPEPHEPKLSDRDVLLKVLDLLEKAGEAASLLKKQLAVA